METSDSDIHLNVSIVADRDAVSGFLLAGIGERKSEDKNFLITTEDTSVSEIESFITKEIKRQDIAVIIISQTDANRIRNILNKKTTVQPAIIEIPSKRYPYDPESDPIMKLASLYRHGGER